MVKLRALSILTGLLVASPVYAQFTPTVTLEPIPANLRRLSLEDVNPDTEVAIRLSWIANHSTTQPYEAEVTYDQARTPESMRRILPSHHSRPWSIVRG